MLKKRDEVRRQAFQMSRKGKIFIEADGMRTFAGSKENDIWIWLAAGRRTGLIAGCHAGKKDDARAAALWGSLSEGCKKNGIFFTAGRLTQKHFRLAGMKLPAKEAERQAIPGGLI